MKNKHIAASCILAYAIVIAAGMIALRIESGFWAEGRDLVRGLVRIVFATYVAYALTVEQPWAKSFAIYGGGVFGLVSLLGSIAGIILGAGQELIIPARTLIVGIISSLPLIGAALVLKFRKDASGI